MAIEFEHTDTFCGEANYCWVHRERIENADQLSDLALVRRAKAFAGLTGVPCTRESYGDQIVLRPRGMCQILFISYVE